MSEIVNLLPNPPADTPLRINGGILSFKQSVAWLRWLNAIYDLGEQRRISATLDFPNTAAQSSSELTVTITAFAVAANSFVILRETAAAPANTYFTARVSAANQITVRFHNYSAGAINPAALDFEFLILPRV